MYTAKKCASWNKSVDILEQTFYQQADIRMRSHGLWELVDDKSVASYFSKLILLQVVLFEQTCCNLIKFTSLFQLVYNLLTRW